MIEDTRRVQTAVIGRPASDVPVFLPYDPREFDHFKRQHPNKSFWCGTLLGGCGKELSAKRYTDRVCHFAHHPPVRCSRTANSESSADHLYIAQALTKWLAKQNHPGAKASYPSLGAGPGGAVDIRLAGGRRLIRVQMARQGLRQWQQATDELSKQADQVDWLFGPDSMLAHNRVDTHGYAIRVECRTVGATREVRIGTQLPGNTVEWTTLSECWMTRDDIVTPSLARTPPGIAPRQSAHAASPEQPAALGQVSFQLADNTVAFTDAVPIGDAQSTTDTAGRLYDAEVQPLGSGVSRAHIYLPGSTPVPSGARVYVLQGRVTLTPNRAAGPETPAWLLTADGTRGLDAREASRWGGLKPNQHEATPPASVPSKRPPSPPRPGLGDEKIIAAFRQTLEITARARSRVKWSTLTNRVKATPKSFTSEHRLQLLIALDSPRVTGKPVLTSLIMGDGGGPAPFFADVLAGLGWAPGLSPDVSRHIHQRELQRVYSVYDKKPSDAASAPQRQPEPQPAAPPSAVELRKHLKAQARSGGTGITWGSLSEAAGIDFEALSDKQRTNLLFRVDDPLEDDDLMYAALVVGNDAKPLPYFPEILRRHGRPVPGLQSEAHWARQAEVARIRDAYSDTTSRQRGTRSTLPDAAPAPAPAQAERRLDLAAFAALGTLAGLRWRFDFARKSGDLPEAKRVWQMAGKLYGTKLPPEAQDKQRAHLVDMSTWVHKRENEIVLAELRPLLDELMNTGGSTTDEALRDALAHAKALKQAHHGKLPQDLRDTLDACYERFGETTAPPTESWDL
ncbi:competence protein CoiA family protein [Streptomyces mirabilis]|uniref:competence protein CoiA family protein n=1 Tax=Streptomyces mirabilis TaxID=68239 RepID=UPI00367B8A46